MDSKNQDDMSGVLKLLSSAVLLVITLAIVIIYGNYYPNVIKEEVVTCVNNSEDGKETFNNIIAQVNENNIYDDIKLNNNLNKYININSATVSSSKNKIIENIINTFDIKVDGFAISISDNTFGYVTSNEQRYSILQEVCETYIKELGIDINEVSQIQVTGKIEATPYKVNLSQLSERNEIAEEIYKSAVINDNLLGLTLSVRCSEEEVIEPSTIISYDDELYMGESTTTQGESGSKLVYKEVTYDGLNKSGEKVIDEEVIVEAKPMVIHRGSKNPYNDGVAFLTRPTRGGYMSSSYGESRAYSYHKGIDIAKDLGEEVTAAIDGEIVFAGYNDGGYGNLIIIQHDNDMKTYYAHLNEIYVSEGEEVGTGDVIGTIGSTGLSTGPHLHFELRVNDEPVNPVDYIEG